MKLAERAYVAGIIDGEGTITLVKKHGNNLHSPEITVANTSLELLLWLQQRIGGLIKKKVRKMAQHRQAYTWVIRDNRVLSLLQEIGSLLLIKRRHAELLMQRYKACTPRNGKYTSELLEKKQELVAEIRKLNSRQI